MRKLKTIRTATERKRLELVGLATLAEILTKIPISERTLHRYIATGKIRAYKMDGKLLFNPADLADMLGRRSVGGGPRASLLREKSSEDGGAAEQLLKEKISEELSQPKTKFLEFEWHDNWHIMTEDQAKQFFEQKFGSINWLDFTENEDE
jgi:hypothetical protein